MKSVVVGLAAVETIRRLGSDERRVVRDNIDRVRREPGEAGIPSGPDFLVPNTWRHVCPGSPVFAVNYRWADSTEEQQAVNALVDWTKQPEDSAKRAAPADAGVVVISIDSFYAL